MESAGLRVAGQGVCRGRRRALAQALVPAEVAPLRRRR